MRLIPKTVLTVAASVITVMISGVISPVAADAREDRPWVYIGSYYSKNACERDWRLRHAKRWSEHLCTQAARHVFWGLYAR